jgi:PAS domain S-box-containing protein
VGLQNFIGQSTECAADYGGNLRKSQKLFALVSEQLNGDILVLDHSGVVVDLNQHAAEVRHMTKEQILGKRCCDQDIPMPFCMDDSMECAFVAAKDSGQEVERIFSEVTPDGRMRYIRAVCFPVPDVVTKLGSSSLYLYIRRDVTEQQRLEQRLQQSEKMAAIGELSTYMAHEIRNPLFSIGGFANALMRNPSLNDLAKEKARIIYDESRRLDVILTNILNFARPTEQALGEFAPETVARQTIELMTIGSEELDITVVLEIEPNLPKAYGNAENLKQCLINLVKNALEAMSGGGTLTLRAARSGSFVRIEVEDTGRGIPADLQRQIFSPFFTTKKQGSGLGLAMTRKNIEEMGGKVSLESTEGKGTCITLSLPVALAVAKGASAKREDTA